METNTNKFLLLLLLLTCFQSCERVTSNKNRSKIETYDAYRTQKIEYRDSLLMLYTVQEWGKVNWSIYGGDSKMYKMEDSDIKYFIGATFYSPDKLKTIVWIGEKEPNAYSREVYDPKTKKPNKLCPGSDDTIYHMSALIGFRDSIDQMWKLYPLDNQFAGCFNKREEVLNVMGQYYFKQMKEHEMSKMIQTGTKAGTMESKAYGYNIQDKDFWDKSWLWEKDTVGAEGLYPFQIRSYWHPNKPTCIKCAEPVIPPKIKYPKEILGLYNNGG